MCCEGRRSSPVINNSSLDIACFFDKYYETYVKEVLDFRGFNPEEPRKWSRLWDYKDVHNVISENMAAENLEAIVLQQCGRNTLATLRAEALAQMSRFKLLTLRNLNFSGSLNFLSSDLGYLHWDKYPFTCLPSNFEPYKLVELVLPRSNIRQLWQGIKTLHKLTYIDLSHLRNLIVMPSFLEIPNLEYLNLEGCIKLVQIDPSIGILKRISKLILKNCKSLVSIPNTVFGLSSLLHLNLLGCPKLLNSQQSEGQRQTEHLEMLDNKESTTQYQLTPFIYNILNQNFGFSIFRKKEGSVGLSLPLLYRLPCLQYLDLSFCNLIQIPDAIGWLHCLETLNLGGNNFVTLPSIKELSKLRFLNLEHCKQLKCLPELPSKTVLPIKDFFFYHDGLYVFDCPSLIEMECCYRMAFSWMIQQLKVHMKSDLLKRIIDIVIPGTQIPMWCNKQNVGSSIRMDPLPNMDNKNLIGVACCVTFVAHDDPTSLGEGWIGIGFKSKEGGFSRSIPIHLGRDQITVNLEHLLLSFFTREQFKSSTKRYNDIELAAHVSQPIGLHLEVKNCGYRWIFKEDLEQLNPAYDVWWKFVSSKHVSNK